MSPSNQKPVARLIITGNRYVNQPITIDATTSSDPDGRIKEVIYQTGDGEEYRSSKPGAVIHYYKNHGDYDVTVVVKDNKNAIDSESMRIGIFQIGPVILVENQTASFDSSTGESIPVTFPDPPTPIGGVPPYFYLYSRDEDELFLIGESTVRVTVTDSVGNVGQFTLTIIVVDTSVPPEPPVNPYPIVISQLPNQTAVSPDGNPVSMSWGNPTISGGVPPYTTVYTFNGNVITSPYAFPAQLISTVIVSVTDDDDVTYTSSFTVNITYTPPPPNPDPPENPEDDIPPQPPIPPGTDFPPYIPVGPIIDYTIGTGYPERRFYMSSQWWDSLSNDIDNSRHFHIELAIPRDCRTGIIRFDIKVFLFHPDGFIFQGIRKVVRRTNYPSFEWMPVYVPGWEGGRRNEPPTFEHTTEYWTPCFIDVRGTPPGDYTIEFDAQMLRPDGQNVQSRMICQIHLDEAGTLSPVNSTSMQAEGWVSNNMSGNQFGYLSVQSWGVRTFESDPMQTITIKPRAIVGRTVRLVALKNPDMHAHPPNYGTVLLDTTFIQPPSPPKIFLANPAMNLGDRLFLRISDSNIATIGAAAQVQVYKLCAG